MAALGRQDVIGFVRHIPLWLMRVLGLAEVREDDDPWNTKPRGPSAQPARRRVPVVVSSARVRMRPCL
jgi:hypothetical protein